MWFGGKADVILLKPLDIHLEHISQKLDVFACTHVCVYVGVVFAFVAVFWFTDELALTPR